MKSIKTLKFTIAIIIRRQLLCSTQLLSKSTIPALPPEGIMLIYSHEFDHCQQLPEILNSTALSINMY